MGKGSKSQTVTTKVDPQTQAYQQMVRGAAVNAANNYQAPGMDASTQQAIANLGGAAGGLNLGMGALSGDPAAMAQLMNPYNQQVIGQMNQQYGHLANQTMNAINDQATQAGAFGGSRAAVAQGVGLANLNANQAMTQAQLLQSGYQNAQQQAAQLANLGMGANGQLAQLGDYARQIQIQQNPYLSKLQLLQQGLQGMQSGGSTTQPSGSSPFGSLLGGAASGAAIGSAIPGLGTGLGAAIGGGLGLLGNIF